MRKPRPEVPPTHMFNRDLQYFRRWTALNSSAAPATAPIVTAIHPNAAPLLLHFNMRGMSTYRQGSGPSVSVLATRSNEIGARTITSHAAAAAEWTIALRAGKESRHGCSFRTLVRNNFWAFVSGISHIHVAKAIAAVLGCVIQPDRLAVTGKRATDLLHSSSHLSLLKRSSKSKRLKQTFVPCSSVNIIAMTSSHGNKYPQHLRSILSIMTTKPAAKSEPLHTNSTILMTYNRTKSRYIGSRSAQ